MEPITYMGSNVLVLELAENNLFNFDSKRGVFSVKQLARLFEYVQNEKEYLLVLLMIFIIVNCMTVRTLTG